MHLACVWRIWTSRSILAMTTISKLLQATNIIIQLQLSLCLFWCIATTCIVLTIRIWIFLVCLFALQYNHHTCTYTLAWTIAYTTYTHCHTHTHAHTRHLHPLSHTHTYTRTYTHKIVISLHRVCTPLLWHSLHPLSYLHNYITCTAHTHTHTHKYVHTCTSKLIDLHKVELDQSIQHF